MFTPEGFLEAREQHYQKLFGSLTHPVMHSTDAAAVHIDTYQFAPNDRRDYWTLVTGGMSDKRQPKPVDARRTEILMYAAEPSGWMFSVLKGLAEMPFENSTWLHWGHTVQNGMPMTATPSALTAFFFLPPYFESPEINKLSLDGDQVDFLWMIPITEAERAYAVQHGSAELEKLIERANLSPAVDESRESLV